MKQSKTVLLVTLKYLYQDSKSLGGIVRLMGDVVAVFVFIDETT